ncbi:MAG TPA: hypothetical protein VHQ24_11590 [Lachnospiraceae bacterium]|nr:hypothetical protein [Lachnospiraceae bacterium]
MLYGNQRILYITEQRLVKLALDGTCFLWAPTVCYQEEENVYYVFFAVASRRHPGKCFYVASTQDFLTYSGPTYGPNNKVGYIPFIADSKDDLDKANFRRLRKEEFQLPQGAKHGSFIPITKEEYDTLVEKWGL